MRSALVLKGLVASVVAVVMAFGACAAVAQEQDKAPPIIRLSVIGDAIYTPKQPNGDWEKDVKMRVSVDWKKFHESVNVELGRKKAKDGPVVVMVHGFMGDPTAAIEELKNDKRMPPQTSENPHDFSFHFVKDNQPLWRNTTSWPHGLGLAQVGDKYDGKGLPIAFAWQSKIGVSPGGLAIKFVGAALNRAITKNDASDFWEVLNGLSAVLSKIDSVAGARRELDAIADSLTTAENLIVRVGRKAGLQDVYKVPYDDAEQAGVALAKTIGELDTALPPKRRIDLFCHSLGTRVVLEALRHLAKTKDKALKRVGQVILVGGAEYSTRAREVVKSIRELDDGKAGSWMREDEGPSFYNFTTQADNVLRILAEKYQPIEEGLKETIGRYGLKDEDGRWIDLRLDAEKDETHLLNALLKQRNLRFKVNGNNEYRGVNIGVVNHWHYFTEEGNMKLFREILHDPKSWQVADLKRKLKELKDKGAPK